jgi:hypothetical protein
MIQATNIPIRDIKGTSTGAITENSRRILTKAKDSWGRRHTLHQDQALGNIVSVHLQTDVLSGAQGSQQLYLHRCDYEPFQ